jgi:hypothetical protein
MQAVFIRIYRGLAGIILAGLVLEVYLIGAALFGAVPLQLHRSLGSILAVAILLLLVLTLIARPGRRVVGLAALLTVLVVVQVMLPSLRTGLPAVAALHAVNALALLGVTATIARSPVALDTIGDDRSPSVPSATGGHAIPQE